MAPATDQTVYGGNPFRRKAATSQGLAYDTSNNPSSPSPSNPFPGVGLGLDTQIPNDYRSDAFATLDSTPQSAIPRQPFTTFRPSIPDNDSLGPDDDTLQSRPKKIVKKVRVQSPPPSSPEDVVPVTKSESDEYSYDDEDNEDAQSNGSANDGDRVNPFGAKDSKSEVAEQTKPAVPSSGPPANPFARTLQDMEPTAHGDDGTSAAAGPTKGAMDVHSFKRLLLTGQSNSPPAPRGADAAVNSQSITGTGGLHDAASSTDASSVSRQSLFDQMLDTPRTSHDISEPETIERTAASIPTSRFAVSSRSGSARPKPPPPSSRHGKLIKVELGAESRSPDAQESSRPDDQQPSQPQAADSDVNKPLPPPPARSSEDEARESPFDREAAGKTPEAFNEDHKVPISPAASITRSRSESQGSTQSKRAAVPPQAPPPRRHARSESKVVPSQSKNNDEDPPRSSLDSTRSRSESIRAGIGSGSAFAPAPPPPRRPNHGRSNSTYSNVSQPSAISPQGIFAESQKFGSPSPEDRANLDGTGSPLQAEMSRESTPRIAAPPPPPARNSSVRRPLSSQRVSEASNVSAGGRRPAGNRDSFIAPPPPPPPRQRGSSRGSMESHTRPALKDLNSQSGGEAPVSTTLAAANSLPTGVVENQGADILADLDALQREVDALMKQANAG
ncbi:uncharacterized protein B0I36DRAFT_363776 [Microdochium trichocladiopsis]|uniref:Uncharacterized protein n=1 Tax=Microdochium trichocladiopsis TaxID=1682393 RepID=A0A9P9BSV1_9PEZI|nr:uncharacterized protein B0I36DRAFT_363776 [Microdochium trichocladiopsis]KAH7029201.1 hypothetical protein B0I36DRAFT_363776 [Microdochium trichocladiopsis]